MELIKNSKGLALGINTVVIIVIAIIVLVLVFMYLRGGISIGEKISIEERTEKSLEEEFGEEGFSLEYKCIGRTTMDNEDCTKCAKYYKEYYGYTDLSTSCNYLTACGRLCKWDGSMCVRKSADCPNIPTESYCNDLIRAKGCRWGIA